MKKQELENNTEEVEIDLSGFSIDSLMFIIKDMHENDMTFNEWVCAALKEAIKARECNSLCEDKKINESSEGVQGENV